MNKIIKATVATAAGVTLLLGGAGTFAYWNDSVAASAGTPIAAGNLQVEDSGAAGTWTNGAGETISIADYRVVPGDVLTYSKTLNVLAEGDDLSAKLGITDSSITAASNAAADVALQAALQKETTLTAAGEGIVATGDNTYTVVPGAASLAEDVTVEATITFPEGAEGEFNDAKLGSVDLSDFTVTLTQIVE